MRYSRSDSCASFDRSCLLQLRIRGREIPRPGRQYVVSLELKLEPFVAREEVLAIEKVCSLRWRVTILAPFQIH